VIRAFRELHAEPYLADGLLQLAWFARERGAADEAFAAAAEAFEIGVRLEDGSMACRALDELGAALSALGNDAAAATVRGYADHHAAHAAGFTSAHDAARHAPLGERLRERDPAAYARGRDAALDDIVVLLAGGAGASLRAV
jgi:hypothetical protein